METEKKLRRMIVALEREMNRLKSISYIDYQAMTADEQNVMDLVIQRNKGEIDILADAIRAMASLPLVPTVESEQ